MFDSMMKRGISSFLLTYERMRANGASQTEALEAVVHSYQSLSAEKQGVLWLRFKRNRRTDEPEVDSFGIHKHQAELASLIFQMFWEQSGPLDDKTCTLISRQTVEVFAEHPIKWS